MRVKLIVSILFLGFSTRINAQDSLDSLLLSLRGNEKNIVDNHFKSTRIVNTQSVEQIAKGDLDFRILHRFGKVNGGAYNLFGLDQANIRIGLDYGLTDNLTLGLGRSNVNKDFDGSFKLRILQQQSGKKNIPIHLSYSAGIVLRSLKWTNLERNNLFSSRLTFFNQILISRKFSESITIQLSPTMVHRNFVSTPSEKNDVYSIGIGGRVKLTKRVALNADYQYVFPGQLNSSNRLTNPLSLGFDIETGGHVFQLHFTNSLGLNEKQFITETTGNIGKGDIHFGFNISRIFTLGDNRSKAQKHW